MVWRIERATSDRSHCEECDKSIAEGEHRFGRRETSTWYHLACAPAGKPRAFKPFAAEAAKLLAASRVAPKPAPPATPAPRNLELEARLLANPDDPATRAVFADWLQSHGDPWGEMLAYLDAGKSKDAKRVMKEHAESFTSGFGPHLFKWRNGFIDHVSAGTGRPQKVMALVEKVFTLPATILTRELLFPIAPDTKLAARLSACAPRGLRRLFCWMSNGVSDLDIPSLERLTLYSVRDGDCDAKGLQGLFDATRLPNLRRLELLNMLPVAIVSALIGSKLLRRIERLDMVQNCCDADGARLLLDNAPAFQHLKMFSAVLPGEHQARFDELFAVQRAAWNEAHKAESAAAKSRD